MKAYNEGRQAYFAGIPLYSGNPYGLFTEEHEDWFNGWVDAEYDTIECEM